MPVYTLHRHEVIALPPRAAWDFFSDPRNLQHITPPELGFEIVTAHLPSRIYAGLMIQYRVRPLAGIPMTWLSEITTVKEGEYFVDEQRVGPYALWHHEHWVRDAGNGRTEIEDLVTYRMPLGWLGRLAHRVFVRRRLEGIFQFRTTAMLRLTGSKAKNFDAGESAAALGA